jgi:hypothetical protein
MHGWHWLHLGGATAARVAKLRRGSRLFKVQHRLLRSPALSTRFHVSKPHALYPLPRMGRGLRHALLALLVFFLFALLAAPGVTAGQATIDDTNGDSVTGAIPAYSGKWEEENQCSFCSAFQQFQQSFNKDWLKDGTWHASRTPGATVTLQFTGKPQRHPVIFVRSNRTIGTSLQVFFFVPLVGEHTACAFSLDDEPAWNLDLQPTNAPPFLSFNHQVFSVSDLENIEHTLVISVSALVVFDYATYE